MTDKVYDVMDEMIASELKVTLSKYVNVIESMDYDDCNFIITTILLNDKDNLDRAINLFNEYLIK